MIVSRMKTHDRSRKVRLAPAGALETLGDEELCAVTGGRGATSGGGRKEKPLAYFTITMTNVLISS